MHSKCHFFRFQILPFLKGLQSPFLWICIANLLGFNLTIAQIENNNPSFSFPSNSSNEDNPLFQPLEEENPYLKADFMDKPLDMTDPMLDNKGPKINMEDQEKFLNAGDI